MQAFLPYALYPKPDLPVEGLKTSLSSIASSSKAGKSGTSE